MNKRGYVFGFGVVEYDCRCLLCSLLCLWGVCVCCLCLFGVRMCSVWCFWGYFVIAQNERCERNIMFHYDYFRNSIIK